MVLLCYILLVLITIYVIWVSLAIVKRSGSLILVVPIAVMYFWSIFGAWSWIPLKLSGGSYFYEDILFAVNIDENYLLMLLYYSLFIVFFCTFIMNHIKRNRNQNCDNNLLYREEIEKLAGNSHYNLILYVLFGIFVLSSYRDIIAAMSSNVSAYSLSRFDSTVKNGSLIQFCGDTFTYLAVPILYTQNHRFRRIIVVILFGLYFVFNFLLGNRNILICDLVIAAVLYTQLHGLKNAFKPRNIVLVAVLFFMIQIHYCPVKVD